MKIKGIITCSKCGEYVDTLYFDERIETGICPACHNNEMNYTVAIMSIIISMIIFFSIC